MPRSLNGRTSSPRSLLPDAKEDSILVIGTSFKTSPVGFREDLSRFLEKERVSADALYAAEMIELQTCNRLEFYLFAQAPENSERSFLLALPRRLADPNRFYFLRGPDAMRHLFALASGLDSMVVGEDQILSQIRGASRQARMAGSSRAILSTLFDAAVGVSKRTREIGAMPDAASSVSSSALKVGVEALGRPPKQVLLIGTGKVARLAACELKGCRLFVATRRKEIHPQLAHATAVSYAQIPAVARRSDMIISATKSRGYVIKAGDLPDRPRRVLLDLAFPRNIDPTIKKSRRNQLFDLDDLAVRFASLEADDFAGGARSIVESEMTSFRRWLTASRLSKALPNLYRWAESVRSSETQLATRRLSRLSPKEREIVEAMGRRIVSKLLAPTAKFSKSSTEDLSQEERLEILNRVFFGDVDD